MNLLKVVPGSVLWLKSYNELAERNLRREAEERGVEAGRLIFAPRVDDAAEHLARYRVADLFLDTRPYNAHATAMDALWSGLPVLTCSGRSFQGRVAGSLLRSAGLSELVTETLDEYEARARRLALEPELLAGLRGRLERSRSSAPVFDVRRLCRHLERAYRQMWEKWREGDPPRGFEVAGESGEATAYSKFDG
jgi:predicted O-linked N-acetylglucosamine transferase (SPINDLY family)